MLRTRWESALPAARPSPSPASAASRPPDGTPRLRSGGCRGPRGPNPGPNLIPPLAGEGVDLGAAGYRAAPPPMPAQAWRGGGWAGAGRPVVTPSPTPPHGRKRPRAHPRRNPRRTEPRASRRAGGGEVKPGSGAWGTRRGFCRRVIGN